MVARTRREDCASDLEFDAWLGGSIEPELGRALEIHVARCARCRSRCEDLSAQRQAFLERMPNWDVLAASVSAQAPPMPTTPPRRAARFMACSSVAALLVMLVLVLPRTHTSGVRSKGSPHIGAFLKRGERVEPIESGDVVQPGDLIRFTYSSDVSTYFGLLNRDDLSAVTYYPLAQHMVRIEAGKDVALDFSIKLDGRLGSERVHGVFCETPEALEPLRAELAITGRLSPRPHCHIDLLTMTKQPPRH